MNATRTELIKNLEDLTKQERKIYLKIQRINTRPSEKNMMDILSGQSPLTELNSESNRMLQGMRYLELLIKKAKL